MAIENGFNRDLLEHLRNPPTIHIVADYGEGDSAYKRVSEALKDNVGFVDIKEANVPSFNVVAAGFQIYELAVERIAARERGDEFSGRNTYFYVNVAPRRDDLNRRKKNAGEPPICARLKEGLIVFGVIGIEGLSVIKPLIEEIRYVSFRPSGSSFRSLHDFILPFSQIFKGDNSPLGQALDKRTIPDLEPWIVAYIDGYRNVKLTATCGDLVDVWRNVRHSDDHGKIPNGRLSFGKKVLITTFRADNFDKVRADLRSLYGHGGASGGISSGRGAFIRDLGPENAVVGTYADGIFGVKPGEWALAEGSSGFWNKRCLEVAIRGGKANQILQTNVGDRLQVVPAPPRFLNRLRAGTGMI